MKVRSLLSNIWIPAQYLWRDIIELKVAQLAQHTIEYYRSSTNDTYWVRHLPSVRAREPVEMFWRYIKFATTHISGTSCTESIFIKAMYERRTFWFHTFQERQIFPVIIKFWTLGSLFWLKLIRVSNERSSCPSLLVRVLVRVRPIRNTFEEME